MRNAFASEITALAAEDPRAVLLMGDIGNRLFDDYRSKFADRFLNCGVAEANMIGIAAGMALCGLRPVAYTIAAFSTVRCLEQIRVDVAFQNLPVVIVGVGGGLSYAELNATHHSCEDIAMLRVLPNMAVVCPGDAIEVRLALRAALRREGPTYLRLGKKGEPVVHREPPEFEIGRGIVVRPGSQVCLLSTGNMLPTALQAADLLKDRLSTQVVSFHTVKPLDESLLERAFSSFDLVVSLEEHSVLGGLGGAIAEWLTEHPVPKPRLLRLGTDDRFIYQATDQEHARALYNLAPEAVARRILETCRLEA